MEKNLETEYTYIYIYIYIYMMNSFYVHLKHCKSTILQLKKH